ncbi:MAG TPA: sigma-54 dependent transcriptional regulator [Candidatus Kapabacteria bacterium]|nr:sigma-54 dependent transcriptional regulator [Candidatus Kapabacteria bacterium]
MLKSTTKFAPFRSELAESDPVGSTLAAKRSITTGTSNGSSPMRNGQAAASPKTLVPPRTSVAAGPDVRSGLSRPIATPIVPPASNELALKTQSQPAPILIVDDEPFVADLIYHWVHSVWDYPAIVANDGDSAIIAMREQHPRMVLLDIQLPDLNGIDVLRAMRSADEFLPIVMVSAQESISVAVEALQAGAYDYLTKPIDTERLQVIIRNALTHYAFHEQMRALRAELNNRYDFSQIVSADPHMHTVFKLMRKAAESDITVCILGESGTGKELVARGLHANGPRRDKPFQVVNCAAIPHELLESELFGHERGSFTGAIGRKIGKFEAANGGTLFLDEIGDMDLTLQAKLLRAIQEREFERVGGTESVKVDVRIICATNTDLHEAILEKRFREDLYYRISTFPIMLPPLRQRRGDILLLAETFLTRFSTRQGKNVTTISKPAVEAMLAYSWPGNIREIESMVERAVLLCDGDSITLQDLPLPIRRFYETREEIEAHAYESMRDFFDPEKNKTVLPIEEIKRYAVYHALHACDGNISEASLKLDISRSTMYRFLELYHIETQNGVAVLNEAAVPQPSLEVATEA